MNEKQRSQQQYKYNDEANRIEINLLIFEIYRAPIGMIIIWQNT